MKHNFYEDRMHISKSHRSALTGLNPVEFQHDHLEVVIATVEETF